MESRHDLDRIPNPFERYEDQRRISPSKTRSHYAFDAHCAHPARSHYVMDYQNPPAQMRSFSKAVYYHSPRSPVSDARSPFLLPNSAYDYTAYSMPFREQPTQSDYDYTPYSQPTMPPAYYTPAPFMQPAHASPFYYQRPPNPSYHHREPIPMYNLGIPYYLNNPMHAAFSSPSPEITSVDTEMDNLRIPHQFHENPHRTFLRRPTTPDNETINKYVRGVESATDLHKLDVNFEPKTPRSRLGSHGSSDHGYHLRDFSVDSIKDLKALPSFSSMSLPNEPSRNVDTAKEP